MGASVELAGLRADPGDLTRSFEQPANGDDRDLLADPDRLSTCRPDRCADPGALLGALGRSSAAARPFLSVAVDDLPSLIAAPMRSVTQSLSRSYIRPELVEFGALLVAMRWISLKSIGESASCMVSNRSSRTA